jgi:hypothetical protein
LIAQDLTDGEYDLTIYVPTKGRPSNALRLRDAFYDTTSLNSRIVFILSTNDPKLDAYTRTDLQDILIVQPDKPGFVSPLNLGYREDRRQHYSYAVGFMGDDHLPRTKAWDERMVAELLEMQGGFVYANDGFQGANIPTSIVMSSEIPLALGFMTLPSLKHLWADDWWLAMGNALNKIKYLPDVMIEHLHPAAGKATSDAGYLFSGSFELDQEDRKEYERYLKEDLESDVRIVQGTLRRHYYEE